MFWDFIFSSILEKNLSNHVVIQVCYNALWFFLCVFLTAIHSTSKESQHKEFLVCSVTRYIRNVLNVVLASVTWFHRDFIHHSKNTVPGMWPFIFGNILLETLKNSWISFLECSSDAEHDWTWTYSLSQANSAWDNLYF